MKKTVDTLLVLVLMTLGACSTSNSNENQTNFGKAIDTSGAIQISEAVALLSTTDSTACIVVGEVTSVCQGEGCWFKLKQAQGEDVLVLTREQSFSVPKNLSGKSVFLQGVIHWEKGAGNDTTSREPVILADGVIIR
jgi:hypothetical protein